MNTNRHEFFEHCFGYQVFATYVRHLVLRQLYYHLFLLAFIRVHSRLEFLMSSWRDQILREFTPQVARLTLVADPDVLLLEEGILHGIRE